jgi:hypothetical protein
MLVVVFMFATAPTSTQASPQRLQSFFERAYNACTYFDVYCVNFAFFLLFFGVSHDVSCGARFLKLEAALWRRVVVRSCVMVRASDLDVPSYSSVHTIDVSARCRASVSSINEKMQSVD